MKGILEAVKELLPDDFTPEKVTHKYGRPENMCDVCRKSGRKGFVTWEELDEDGFPVGYSYKCPNYMKCSYFTGEREKIIDRWIAESGIPDEYQKKTVKEFSAKSDAVKKMKNVAISFAYKCAEDGFNDWLYLAGQTGCGKTHLVCAIGVNIMKHGKRLKMFSWSELMRQVKNFSYADFDEAKTVPVLILDDLYKGNPTEEEKKRTFELIDFRVGRNLQTIITTERENREMVEIDQAVIGRIVSACNGYWAIVPKDAMANYRISEFLA